jgi:hypothetical protein
VRKDEFRILQDQDKDLIKKFKEVSCGDTNESIIKQIEAMKAEIEGITNNLAPFKKSGAKMIT